MSTQINGAQLPLGIVEQLVGVSAEGLLVRQPDSNGDGVLEVPVTAQVNDLTGGLAEFAAGTRIVRPKSGQKTQDGQPARTAARLATQAGTRIDVFRDTSKWTATAGTPALSLVTGVSNTTGLPTGADPLPRTGSDMMMKVVPSTNADVIRCYPESFPATNIAGKLGIWVYIADLPLYGPGETPTGSLQFGVSTDPAATGYAGAIFFNSNQIREGWNFLKWVKTVDFSGVQSSTVGAGGVEQQFLGMAESSSAYYAYGNIVTGTLRYLDLRMNNLQGATLYFESLWTDFTSKAQIVLGADACGKDFVNYAMPLFRQYGWVGYVAEPRRVAGSYAMVADWKDDATDGTGATDNNTDICYAEGWDIINHSMNHMPMGAYTDAGRIAAEINATNGWLRARGIVRGLEFYASPQSSTSRLSEAVIKNCCGIVLQRHARKQNTSVTPWGIDNPHHVGSIDMGASVGGGGGVDGAGMVKYSNMVKYLDLIERYGDTGFMFWHFLTTLGDDGSGESAGPGDGLTIPLSNFSKFLAEVRERELAGRLTVARGMTGFWYGEDC